MVHHRLDQKAATTIPRTALIPITLLLLRTHRLFASARRHHQVIMSRLPTVPLHPRRRRRRLPVPGLHHPRVLSLHSLLPQLLTLHHRLLTTVVLPHLPQRLTHLHPAVSLTHPRTQAPGLRRLLLAPLEDPLMVLPMEAQRARALCTDTLGWSLRLSRTILLVTTALSPSLLICLPQQASTILGMRTKRSSFPR